MPWPNGSVQLVSLNPIQEMNGSQQGWVAVLRDITHLKHLEELKTHGSSPKLPAGSVRRWPRR
jgi:hypothetical protein